MGNGTALVDAETAAVPTRVAVAVDEAVVTWLTAAVGVCDIVAVADTADVVERVTLAGLLTVAETTVPAVVSPAVPAKLTTAAVAVGADVVAWLTVPGLVTRTSAATTAVVVRVATASTAAAAVPDAVLACVTAPASERAAAVVLAAVVVAEAAPVSDRAAAVAIAAVVTAVAFAVVVELTAGAGFRRSSRVQ